jgi:eukaryotic translation initiation factor 2C
MDEFRGREIKTATGGFRKKIQSLGPDSSYQFEWNKPNGQKVKISIKDYMKQHYKIDLKYPQLPCVNLGKMALVPMELCRTELKHQKKLTDRQTADVIKQTAVKATERLSYIQNWINKSSIDKDPILKEFNIDVSLKLVEVDGRVLEAPDIAYGPQNGVSSKKIAENGSWDHRNFKFNKTIEIKNWVLINYSNRVRGQQAEDFISSLMKMGNIHGIPISDPLDMIDLCRKNREADVAKSFSEIVTKYKQLALIVVILPGTSRIYNVIKTCGDLEYGIATQAVEDRNVNRINEQTVSNILLKINTKLGGRNFVLVQSSQLFKNYLSKYFDTPIMIMGADVTHPAPGDKTVTESIASVVGSHDRNCSNYGARLYAQRSPRGQAYEMIHDLDKMVFSFLETFFRENKLYPKKILFYRDGVSEGQFQLVLRHEINKIREACKKINPAYEPAITFIVVQKRHHTRLFAVDDRDKVNFKFNLFKLYTNPIQTFFFFFLIER